jgi:hypothetical protein
MLVGGAVSFGVALNPCGTSPELELVAGEQNAISLQHNHRSHGKLKNLIAINDLISVAHPVGGDAQLGEIDAAYLEGGSLGSYFILSEN